MSAGAFVYKRYLKWTAFASGVVTPAFASGVKHDFNLIPRVAHYTRRGYFAFWTTRGTVPYYVLPVSCVLDPSRGILSWTRRSKKERKKMSYFIICRTAVRPLNRVLCL